jgi:cytochrome P450
MSSLSLPIARTPRRVQDLPAPKGIPLLGNALQIKPLQLHRQLEDWAAALGSPFRIRIGREPIVVWTDSELFQDVMRDRPQRFGRGKRIGEVFGEMGIEGLFAAEGTEWVPQRRMVMQALNATHFRGFFGTLRSITERLHRRWLRAAESGATVEMVHELMRYTVDVTSALAFGEDPNTLERDGDRIQSQLGVIFPMLMKRIVAPVPYWRWFKLPADRRLDQALAVVHGYVHELITRARERMLAQPQAEPRNLLEAMLAERDRPDSELSDTTLVANVLTLLLAGEDTTANSLAWTMPFLAADAALQDRLHAEAVAVLGDQAVCARFEDLRAFDLFEATVNESQRLHPVVGMISFAPNEDCVVGDVLLPRGLRNFFVHRPAMLDPRHFADPQRFDPDRWLRGRGDAAHNPRAFLQFGAGPRVCPGRHLATVEMRLVLSMLLAHFEVELAIDPSRIEEVNAFTMMPSTMPVRLHPRRGGR